ncbi:hypothetical protein NM208_g11195 [Fusarium decemcellulare]|uniref:Uncharacterized protein n=1 Tax=Fusarium decemcellulare TaxID=57161 RepID=A0ACC1RVA7_9HYPO|nr:hypothetical protein NM208_g11195 [Fusarium decemcellulare]
MKTCRLLFDKSIEALFKGGFMDEHKLTSVQAICLLVQVAHNFDKSDLICVLISTAIRISQCLNLHRLGADRPGTASVKGDIQNAIDREVRKRVWWFLVRYDWLQIPFQNTCQIHLAQFNTPMPANSFDDAERMIQNGAVVSQPDDVCTSSSWTNCLNQLAVLVWKHQDRVFRVGYPGEDPDRIMRLYDQAIRADREIKDLYSSWPLALREIEDIQLDQPMLNSFPVGLMPGMVLICTAHKILTVHRHFQLSSFRDRRFAFSQLSCIAIAERSIESIQRWPDTLESRISRRMWTTLTHVVSCCITLVFALLFKSQNALTYDSTKVRRYIEFGKDFISQEEQFSSIARRGVKLLTALMNLEGCSDHSLDIEADIGDIVRRVATTDDGSLELSAAEAHQVVFPGSQDFWENIMRDTVWPSYEPSLRTYGSKVCKAGPIIGSGSMSNLATNPGECHLSFIPTTLSLPQFGPVVVDQALLGPGTLTINVLNNNAVIPDQSIAQSLADMTVCVFNKVIVLDLIPPPSRPEDLRSAYMKIKDEKKANDSPGPEDLIEEDIQVPVREGSTVTVRVFKPKNLTPGTAPLAVVTHGGGYITGDRLDEEWTSRIIARQTGAVALSVEYRLTPEHPFPTPVLDCWDVVKWAAKNAATLGANPIRGFIVGGNSAGGNIATTCGVLSVREKLDPPITGLALQVPLISGEEGMPEKWRHEIKSYETGEKAPIMNSAGVRMFLKHYGPDLQSPTFNPWAPGVDLKGFPPVFFQLCGMDPLRDEALIFERHLRKDLGVQTRLNIYSSLPHAFWFIPLPSLEGVTKQVAEDYANGVQWLINQRPA